jgi:hypothetical protein
MSRAGFLCFKHLAANRGYVEDSYLDSNLVCNRADSGPLEEFSALRRT